MPRLPSLHLLALALLLTPAPAAAFFLDTCVEPGDEVADSFFPAPTFDTTPAPTRLGGRLYAIPRNYFNFPHVSCATSDNKGILLRMTLPDLLPRTPETEERLHGSEAAFDRTYLSLIAGPQYVTIPQALLLREGSRIHGLEPPPMIGLQGQVERPVDPQGNPRNHVYFYPDRESAEFIAQCNSPEASRRPLCLIFFVHNDVKWQAQVGRAWMPTWRTLIPALRAKIDGFLVEDSSTGSRP